MPKSFRSSEAPPSPGHRSAPSSPSSRASGEYGPGYLHRVQQTGDPLGRTLTTLCSDLQTSMLRMWLKISYFPHWLLSPPRPHTRRRTAQRRWSI